MPAARSHCSIVSQSLCWVRNRRPFKGEQVILLNRILLSLGATQTNARNQFLAAVQEWLLEPGMELQLWEPNGHCKGASSKGSSPFGINKVSMSFWNFAWSPRFWVSTTFQMLIRAGGGTMGIVVLCCVVLYSPVCCVACGPVESAVRSGGWRLAGLQVCCPLEFARLSCRCQMKHALKCSVTVPQTPRKIPATSEMDCAQINTHCSVRGSRHEGISTLQ